MSTVVIAQFGRMKVNPVTGLVEPPDAAVTLAATFAEQSALVAVANYQLASVNHSYWKVQLGVLGTMFRLHDCLNTDCGPAPTLPPTPTTGTGGGGGSGGGGASGGGSGGGMCYYRVTSIDGYEVNRVLWYCVPR